MEDSVSDAILDHSELGTRLVLSTGEGSSEMYLSKDNQENMVNAQVTASGGDVKLQLKGKFSGCKGAVKMQVCISSVCING